MPDIIQRLKSAYISNPAEALGLIPEVIQKYDEGLIRVLPCKEGTIVFDIDGFYCSLCKKDHNRIEHRAFELSMLPDFGKTVFLTRKEAEKALEREL